MEQNFYLSHVFSKETKLIASEKCMVVLGFINLELTYYLDLILRFS